MLRKRNQRTVDDIYRRANQILTLPKITPVLRGSFRMQGPFDDDDDDYHHDDAPATTPTPTNMVQSLSGSKSRKRSMSHKVGPSGESGACNVCAAPCSSCMHLNQALMESKTEEFSDETCRLNATTQYSVNGIHDTVQSKTRQSLQPATSETSNLVSVGSSHDSLSENADSKAAALRSSDDALDIERPPLSSAGTTGEVGLSPKPLSSLNPGTFLSRHKDSKSIEARDDDISCVSRANDAYVALSNSSRNIDRKIMSCSSTSDTSLGIECSKKRVESMLFDTPSSKDGDATSSSPKENLFESSTEQIGGSSRAAAAIVDVSCQKSIAHISDVPVTVLPKQEAETNSDGQERIGTLKCSGQDEQLHKLDVREPPLQSASGDESDNSDIVEHDVKVCDICGDAGREDMLAICSRCSDGAEHTYCMRKMLRKIPGSNWMCEECKFAEEINSQKQEMEGKKLSKAGSSVQISSKRLAENIEVASAAKRQALETSIGSPKTSSPMRMAALSRESSFKNLDKERLRPAQQVSIGNQSFNDILETARSPVAGPRLQTHKGTLFKSNSFNASNSKPKIKLVDEVIPQKQKGVKDHASLEVKERPTRTIGKSMSFKSANLGRPSASDSKVKMFSPKIAHTVDSKGSKPMKERNAFERKSLSKLDRPPISSTSSSTVSTPKADQASRVDSSLLSFASNSRDLKAQNEGKSSTSKGTGNVGRKPTEVPITSVGVPSATEQKSNHVISKDESVPLNAEKTSNNVDGLMPDGLPRPQETMYQSEKWKESSIRPRSSVMSSSRSTFCQKCKEIGHSAEFCTSGSLEASGSDQSAAAARSSREETHRGSKLKDAIQAALLRKPEIQRKKRTIDQIDDISTSSTDLNSEVASHDQSLVSNKSKIILSAEGTNGGQQAVPRSSTLDSIHIAAATVMQHIVPTPNVKSSGVKPTAKDFTSRGLATSPQLVKMSAIPEYEYIWRGCFEVNRSGSFLELCGGIQAHLSTCVSPRVPEVIRKFPQKLSLNEVPRLSAWPMQFYDGGAKEDNIALYFFAKDLESYERYYKSLLDRMIKNDLALKGIFEGVELLIFPSNQLPENSHRWNMLFFLWGVFRARKAHCSDLSNKSNVPNGRMVPVDRKAFNDVTAMSENLCSPKFMETESSGCDRSCSEVSGDFNEQKISEPICMGLKANTMPQDGENGSKYTSDVSSSEKMRCISPSLREKSPSDQSLRAEVKPLLVVAGANSCNIGEKAQLDCNASIDDKDFSSLKILSSKEDVGGTDTGMVCEKKVLDGGVGAIVSVGYDGATDGIYRDGDRYKHEGELKGAGEHAKRDAVSRRERSTERVECCHQSIERKRPHIDLSDRAPPVASDVVSQSVAWNGVNNMLIDGDNVGKKRKTGENDIYGSGSYGWRNCIGSVESKQMDMGQCLSVEEKVCVEDCNEKVIPEDLGNSTTERRFFPVDPRQGNSSLPWKSLSGGRVEDRLHDGFPNLELALGAETKPQNKGMLPFLVGLGEKKNNQEKPLDKSVVEDKEDDVSASLSLSLSFSVPDKEQPAKAVSKSEQLRPERHHVNTSLLLFGGGFSEK